MLILKPRRIRFLLFGAFPAVLFLSGIAGPIRADDTGSAITPIQSAGNPRAALDAMIRQTTDVNAVIDGQTLLMDAAQIGDLPAVRLLLDRGAKITASAPDWENTPLTLAVTYHHPEIVSFLLARGADTGPHSPPNTIPILRAAAAGNTAVVKSLLKRGISPNVRGVSTGMTPLMWAAFARSLPTFEALLRAGAHPLARDDLGRSALSWAVAVDNIAMVKQLLARKADVNAGDRQGLTPLMYAYHADLIRLLAAHGADVNACCDNGATPLIGAVGRCAVFKRDDGSVRTLIALGADVNARMTNGSTPLSFALRLHLDAIAALLRKAGAKEPPPDAP